MKVTYEYMCGLCGATKSDVFQSQIGEPLRVPSFPDGWRNVLGILVCDRHRIIADLTCIDEDSSSSPPWWRNIEL